MIHCAKATEELERFKFEKPGFYTKLKVHMHFLICTACRKFKRDSEAIDRMLQTNSQNISSNFSDEEKLKMIDRIKS